jgi:Amt family ammonium transporter
VWSFEWVKNDPNAGAFAATGLLGKEGAIDFAGGTVVHIAAGASGLAAVLLLRKRIGYGKQTFHPNSMILTLLGAGLLWFGWFGFNGGSALGANAVAAGAIVATHTAAAVGGLAWMVVEWVHRGKPTVLGLASGAVAGLATVTPAAGYIGVLPALVIGLAAGGLCYFAVVWKGKLRYDDSLDVVGIHGVGGIVGVLATGLFASKAVNPSGADGLFFGNPAQFGIQAITVLATALFSIVGTYLILKLVDGVAGLRVAPEEEAVGLDLTQHNERAYS